MKNYSLLLLRVIGVLVVLFAAVGVTQVYANPECPGNNACSPKENSGWGGSGVGQDDITNNDNVCGKGKGVGNPHCGGEETPPGPPRPPGVPPSGGFGPSFAPRTGSAEEPVTGALLRLGGFGTLFIAGLAVSLRRWRKSLL